MKYWIEFYDGSTKIYEVENKKEAEWYFRMEGDHAVAYGQVLDSSGVEQHPHTVNVGGSIPPLATKGN